MRSQLKELEIVDQKSIKKQPTWLISTHDQPVRLNASNDRWLNRIGQNLWNLISPVHLDPNTIITWLVLIFWSPVDDSELSWLNCSMSNAHVRP